MEGVAASKNHNLTIVSADIDGKTLPNMHYIHLENIYDIVYDPNENFDMLEYAHAGAIEVITGYGDIMVGACKGGSHSEDYEKWNLKCSICRNSWFEGLEDHFRLSRRF